MILIHIRKIIFLIIALFMMSPSYSTATSRCTIAVTDIPHLEANDRSALPGEVSLAGTLAVKQPERLPLPPNGEYVYIALADGSYVYSTRISAQGVVSHRSLYKKLLGLNDLKDAPILGAGEFKIENSKLISFDNRSGTFRGNELNLDFAFESFKQLFATSVAENLKPRDWSKINESHPHYIENTLLDIPHTIWAVELLGQKTFQNILSDPQPKWALKRKLEQLSDITQWLKDNKNTSSVTADELLQSPVESDFPKNHGVPPIDYDSFVAGVEHAKELGVLFQSPEDFVRIKMTGFPRNGEFKEKLVYIQLDQYVLDKNGHTTSVRLHLIGVDEHKDLAYLFAAGTGRFYKEVGDFVRLGLVLKKRSGENKIEFKTITGDDLRFAPFPEDEFKDSVSY